MNSWRTFADIPIIEASASRKVIFRAKVQARIFHWVSPLERTLYSSAQAADAYMQ